MEKSTRITLPDGTVRDRFVDDNGRKRELVLIETPKVPGNQAGYRVSYRDAMKEGDVELSESSVAKLKASVGAAAAALEVAQANAAKGKEPEPKPEPAKVWSDADSKSDIIEELTRRKVAFASKASKSDLLELLNK